MTLTSRRRLVPVSVAIVVAWGCWYTVSLSRAEPPPRGPQGAAPQGNATLPNDTVTFKLRLIDGSNKPVPGTQVGLMARCDASGNDGWTLGGGVTADQRGMAVLTLPEGVSEELSLVAWNPELKLCAIQNLDPDQDDKPIAVRMRPQVRLHGRVTANQLRKAGIPSGPIWVQIYHEDHEALTYIVPPNQAEYEFFLPAGEYDLTMRGNDVVPQEMTLQLNKREKQHKLNDIDLAPVRLALLRGQAAPDLSDVVAWKNSAPMSLSDLKGRVVLLDFWGHWCGPCVRSMPAMMQLHDRYAASGLVIIGVHVPTPRDGITTSEALDRKLSSTRQSLWNGRDLPFPVALTRINEVPYGIGTGDKAPNRVSADYGVMSFPSAVLIDRDGRVVKDFSHHSPRDMALLEQMLSQKPRTVSAR